MKDNALKKLFISVDPGFSGCKMVVGCDEFHIQLPIIPFSILNITEKKDIYTSFSDKDIVWKKDGKVYLIGEKSAKALLTDTTMAAAKQDVENFTTNSSRFTTDEFKIALESCMAYALVYYAKEYEKKMEKTPYNIDDMSSLQIIVGIALPHADINNYCDAIYSAVECVHEFDAIIESNPLHIKYKVKDKDSQVRSQTIMALLNETMDDYGQDMDDAAKDEFLPAVILDAGYRTVGRALLTEALTIEKDASNTTFAMANVNESVSEELKKFNILAPAATIDEHCRRGRTLDGYAVDAKGKREEYDVDIVLVKDEHIARNVDLMMKEFCHIYNNFDGIRKIIVAGGSGKKYYDNIIEYFDNAGLKRAASRCVLAQGTLNGEPVEPVMAIASGLYKALVSEQ